MSITFNGSANTISYSSSLDATKGASSSNPAPSAGYILAANPSASNGLYWIAPPGATAQQIYCDMGEGPDGTKGWMLVASNNAADTSIPGGTGKESQTYELDRNSTNSALAGTVGTGITPNGDYIIGNLINYLPWQSVRVIAWGRNSLNGTYTWPSNLGTYITATWTPPTSVTGADRLTTVTPVASVTIGGNSSLSSSAAYFIVDNVKMDRLTGGYSANSGQSFVGAGGITVSSGDPGSGAYLGHGGATGIAGGSNAGWYDSGNTNQDCQGYTTWVKDNTDYTKTIAIPSQYYLASSTVGTFACTGRIINTTRFQNNTRTTLSSSTNYTLWSPGNVTKVQSNSTLIIMGQMCFTGTGKAPNFEVGAWWQIGSSGKRYDGLLHNGVNDSTVDTQVHAGWHILGQYTTTATGALAVSIGWTPADGSSVRPHDVWNPNVSDDGRSQQHTSEIVILEIGT